MKNLHTFATSSVLALSVAHSTGATLLSEGAATAVSTVNLSTVGTKNWAAWDYRSNTEVSSIPVFSSKSMGAIGTISAITTTNTTAPGKTTVRGPSNMNANADDVFTWSGGTTAVRAGGELAGAFHSNLQQTTNGVHFTITGLPTLADGELYLVNVYFTAFGGTGAVIASNGTTTLPAVAGGVKGTANGSKTTDNAGFRYNPDADTDLLDISVKLDSQSDGSSHAVIQAVAISVIPEPSAALLSALGAMLLVGKRRR